MKIISERTVLGHISSAEDALREPDGRAIRLWERIQVSPSLWSQDQYNGTNGFWVVGVMGNRCLYFNHLEGGWGWGKYEEWGRVSGYHWQDLDLEHVVFQTLFAVDNGGQG